MGNKGNRASNQTDNNAQNQASKQNTTQTNQGAQQQATNQSTQQQQTNQDNSQIKLVGTLSNRLKHLFDKNIHDARTALLQMRMIDAIARMDKIKDRTPLSNQDNSQQTQDSDEQNQSNNSNSKQDKKTKVFIRHEYNIKYDKFKKYENKTNFKNMNEEEFPEYIVQYDETDWEFLNRICREFGIYYCFEHTDLHTGIVFYSNPHDNAGNAEGTNADNSSSGNTVSNSSSSGNDKNVPFKTYKGYENVINGYKADGSYKKDDGKFHLTQDEKKESNSDKDSSSEGISMSMEDVKKVFETGDPFTDTKPFYYSTTDLKYNDDQYVSQWHEVKRCIPAMPSLYGYNPDYDPDKRNILKEKDMGKDTRCKDSREKNNNEQNNHDDNQENANQNSNAHDNKKISHSYDENFTSEKRTDDYNELYTQYYQCNEKEYRAVTYRQEVSPGYKFVLTNHPDLNLNGQYYAKQVEHILEYKPTGRSAADSDHDDMELHYENHVVFLKIDQPFKMLPIPQRKIFGIQTGIVVGGEGQKIYTNRMGQVKVYFHWDSARKSLSNGEMLQKAIWVRVVQWGGAGNECGGFFVPRVGQEVVISFENGNPAKPIIIGCLYNRTTMPPYNLIENEEKITSKTGIKTESLKDTEEGEEKGFNEFSFEDEADNERIFLHAEKDFDQVIKDTRRANIETGSDELVIHKGNRKVEILGEKESNNSTKSDNETDNQKQNNDDGNDILVIKNGNKEIKLDSDQKKKFLTEVRNGDIVNKITQGDCKLELEKGNNAIKLKEGKVEIDIDKGDIAVKLSQGNWEEQIVGNKNVTINNGNYVIKIDGGNMEIYAQDFSIKSKGDITLEAGGNLNLKGANVEVKSAAGANIEASAAMNIKATVVNLN